MREFVKRNRIQIIVLGSAVIISGIVFAFQQIAGSVLFVVTLLLTSLYAFNDQKKWREIKSEFSEEHQQNNQNLGVPSSKFVDQEFQNGEEIIQCEFCGHKIDEIDAFCRNCGNKK